MSDAGDNLDFFHWEDGERWVLSSNRLRMTTFGSPVSMLLSRSPLRLLPILELVSDPLPSDRLLIFKSSADSSAYSGSPEKLSGFTITW